VSALPIFGSKLPGVAHRLRPGAYAVVRDVEGRVAIVEEDGDWYLPGGGLEGHETPEEALVREVHEECACGVEIEAPCGEALEFVVNRAGEPLEVHARYYRARFVGMPTATWLAPARACARVRRSADAWIIRTTSRTSEIARVDPARRLVDLSHTVRDGLITYPGLPSPRIREHLTREDSRRLYASGTEFSIAGIEMVANTGTYLDAPFHRYAGGRDVAELPLESLAELPGLVVRAHGTRAIGPEALERALAGRDLSGHALLVDTGWSRHFGTPAYASGHPHLTVATAELLARRGVALVGIDSLNIDDTAGGERPVHSLLLERDVRIVEHLTNLDALPEDGFRFHAVPVKVRGLGSFPVRAFARLED